MILAEHYKEWVLPALTRNDAWNEYIDAVCNELVTLQKYNMGSFNKSGFNGVEEDITFSDVNDWTICYTYDAAKGIYNLGGDFSIANNKLSFLLVADYEFYAIREYPFVTDRTYRIRFNVSNISAADTRDFTIRLGEGTEQTFQIGINTTEGQLFEFEIEAQDYYLAFGYKDVGHAGGVYSFDITNIEVVGVIDDDDEKERWSVLKRVLNVNNASLEMLELMRDDTTFPAIAGMSKTLLRMIIKDYPTFISYGGSEMASIMMFYFLGYSVNFVSLYARKGDYEAKQYAYLQAKDADTLTSVGIVNGNQISTYRIKLDEGHQIVSGDKLMDATNTFPNGYVTVIGVDREYIDVDTRISVYDDDIMNVDRVYTYAVNPDPSNYFKTTHIDVFFNKKYTSGIELDFAILEEFFTRYLPINVVIRFFGYRSAVAEDEFQIRETGMKFGVGKSLELNIEEEVTFPTQDYAFVVSRPTPVTHKDQWDNDVDGYSFVITHYDPITGDPNFVIIPLV